LDAIAETTYEDSLMGNCPPDLEPTVDELRGVLESAW
jgi:alcohol dehydrogenase